LSSLALAGASTQAGAACTLLREARDVAAATTSARNVIETFLAAPCASAASALAACSPALRCALSSREIVRRTTAAGVLVIVHVEVTVQPPADSGDDRTLVRAASAAARPEACA
jgi:hypothetical protein